MALTLTHSSSYRAFQETISRSMAPLLQKYGAAFRGGADSVEEEWRRRSVQHAELLKRQQEMFHRLLYLGCLCKEGVVQEEAVVDCRLGLLFETRSMHPDGEWPAFTRDKILFLQDLLFADCISEDEFQSTKSVLLQRMADQGGDIDIILLLNPNPSPPPPPPPSNTAEIPPPEHSLSIKNSPIKQVRDAMKLRLKANKTNASPSRHPPHLPLPQRVETAEAVTPIKARDMDMDMDMEKDKEEEKGKEDIGKEIASTSTPLQASKSPLQGGGGGGGSSSAASRVKSIVSGLFQKVQIGGGDGSSKTPEEKRTPWSPAELLRPPRKLHFEEQPLPPTTTTIASTTATEVKLEPILMEECKESDVLKENSITNNMVKEVAVTPKKKIHPKGAAPPADFSTDKVLTENIKSKLSQISTEMAKRDTSRTFTSEQIEAIARRLPIDKDELQRLFPKTWCDQYGDIVLDVVHKEFQLHVRETNRVREKQRARKKRNTVNDENTVIDWQMSGSSDSPLLGKCFDENVPSPARINSPLSSKENKLDESKLTTVWRGNRSLSREMDGIRNRS